MGVVRKVSTFLKKCAHSIWVLQPPSATHDEQSNLRHRILEPNATTVRQHVNERRSETQV